MDRIFEALANEHRRSIIYELSLRPHAISQLAKKESLSLPAIYKHIKVLEDSEFILRKKSGRTNFLALNKHTMRKLHEWIMQFNPYWGNDEESLENYVASIAKAD